MNMFPWSDSAGHSPSGDGRNDNDPIARNPKDTDGPGSAIEPAGSEQNEVVRAMTAAQTAPSAPMWTPNAPKPAASPTEMLHSILRYKWTILVIFVLVSGSLITLIWTQVIPEYQARAEIRVRPIIPRLVFQTDENGRIPFYDSFVNTQVSVMRSLTVLNRVLEREDVPQTQWYKNPPESLKDRIVGNAIPPMERLRDALSVRPRPRTEIIDVSFVDASASDAKVIVNAVLDEYIKYTAKTSSDIDDLKYKQLTERKKSFEDKISGREELLDRLQKQIGTALPDQWLSAKRVYLDQLQTRLSGLQQTIKILEWEIEQAPKPDSNDIPEVTSAQADRRRLYHEDSQWLILDRNVRTIAHQIENSVYGPEHPERLRLIKDKEFAKEELQRREEQLDKQWHRGDVTAPSMPIVVSDPNRPMYASGPGSLQHQLDRIRREEQLVQTRLEEEEKVFKSDFETAQLIKSENSHLKHERELYDAVRERLDHMNVERNVPGSIDVLMYAFSPSQPHNDRRVVFSAMALVFGFGLGGGAAFLRAMRNQAIRSVKDMPQPAQVPFLGNIPLVQMRKAPGKSLCEELERNQVRLLESVRVLRTALLSRLNGRGSTTVLITSADEGTGKSSFTMMLGKSIAQAGRRVLMVDTDFYKMSLSKRFDLLDEPGFIDSLQTGAQETLPVAATKTPGLDILPAGKRRNGDAVYEEIANGAFKACIRRLRQDYHYDVILFDSSPILPVADATILAGQVDGTIIVERENVSQRSHVMSALARLDATGGQLLGTVFVGSSGPQDYGRGYSYSYGYGSHRGKPQNS